MRRRIDAALLWLARRAARRLGYSFVQSAKLDRAIESAEELVSYAKRSGHLTNRYHAGRRVKLLAGQIHAAITRPQIGGAP
jgi:hypothetical protein